MRVAEHQNSCLMQGMLHAIQSIIMIHTYDAVDTIYFVTFTNTENGRNVV
jgi:hypothetical protein